MDETLKIINGMVKKGVIGGYAIGGGMAADYYGEPTLTYDLDLFVYFASDADSCELISMSPIYKYLLDLGYKAEAEGFLIEGILVQFLPPYNDLIREALDYAKSVMYNDTRTRIFSLEYVLAIMLQTGRPKDKIRLSNLHEIMKDPNTKTKPDYDKLGKILTDHGLKDKWDEFIEENTK